MDRGSKAELEDAALRYVLDAQPVFETLKRVTTQLAGFALLQAVGARDAHMQDTPLAQARRALGPALDGLRALKPPSTATHHHRHLSGLAGALEQALAHSEASIVGARREELAQAARPYLDAAISHLRSASRLLPGFEVVSLDQACCACRPQEIAATAPAA
jgi:hypothetical protein